MADFLLEKGAYDNLSYLYCASRGLKKFLRKIIANGVNLHETNSEGRTALHLASMNGHVACVRLLLKEGLDPETRDDQGTKKGTVPFLSIHTGTVPLLFGIVISFLKNTQRYFAYIYYKLFLK